jgi:outer membrane immunogenic protein
MKKLLLRSMALSALIAVPAMAADMPLKAPVSPPLPVWSWTGFYVGANVGEHWGRDSTTSAMNPAFAAQPNGAGFIAVVNGSTPGTVNPRGVIGGLTVGYNFQISNFLWGLEGDVNWLGGEATRSITGFAPPVNPLDVFTTSTRASFLATLRARAGWVFDQTLFYVTGGLAVATIKTADSFGFSGNTDIRATSDSNTRVGGTIGGGLEHAFGNNWSAKIEYLYVAFDSFTTHTPSQTFAQDDIAVSHKYSDNIVRVGLNYRFGYGPVVAKY